MKRLLIAFALISIVGSNAFPMMHMQRVRKVTGCCCPIIASILVSGVAVKAERVVQAKIGSAIAKTLDFTFGKTKTD